MAYSTLSTVVAGAVVAESWGNQVKANFDAGPNALATAAGQLFYATVAGVLVPLNIGTAGQRLQVNAAGTAPEWASARRCLLYLSATQSITSGAATEVLWDAETSDPDGWHSLVSNTGRITPTVAGLFLVTAHVTFNFNATGIRNVSIRKNGAADLAAGDVDVPADPNASVRPSVTRCFLLNGSTDYVNVYATQNSGGALGVTGSATLGTTWFEVVYLGA